MTHPPTHNGGPPDLPLTAKTKLECIQSILEREDLTAAQKCVGAGIVLEADKEWVAEVKTPDLQRYASARDRETVFRATRELDRKGVVSKSSARGQTGRFTVLPPRIVAAIVEAYDELRSGRYEADHGSRVKPDGITSRLHTSEPVRFEPTTSETGRDEADCRRAPAPARIETPSGLVISKESEEDSEEKKREETESKSAGTTALWVFETYNELAQRVGLPVARGLTPERRKAISARLRDHGGREAWEAVLNNIERSAFLQGRNPKHWRPTGLDWFLKSANFVKVIEGAYGNGAHADKPAETTTEYYARLAEELEQEKRP